MRKRSQQRSLMIGLSMTFFLTVIMFRLLWIQTVQSAELTKQATIHWQNDDKILEAKRGTIYDHTKTQSLAWETNAYYFMVDPSQVQNPQQEAKILSPLLQIPEKTLVEKLTKKKKAVTLRDGAKFKYPKSIFDQIIELKKQGKLHGIYGYKTTDRKYSSHEMAHVLGFLNHAGEPIGGIESYYNHWLKGKDGKIEYKESQDGIMVSDGPETFQPPVHGKDLTLTLDVHIQHAVSQALDQAMKKYQAKGAIGIVADPKNGDILAMSNRPTFDPNQVASTYDSEKNGHNKAVESQYEPGSTFKIITLAASINEGLFDPNDTFESGSITVGGQTIHDWNEKGWGSITYQRGVELSSNVAFVKLAEKLEGSRLIEYVERFGFGNVTEQFGSKTGIDLPAEGKGYFYNRPLYTAELATLAFGQGISVTPIQQVAAVSAIANGGYWVRPHLLKEVWDQEKNKKIHTYQPLRKKVIEAETARKVRDLLQKVVSNGTASEANIPGYAVAGKTGTAQKPKPDGGYYENKYIVSFIGFAPKDNPEVVVYVALDEPKSPDGSISGGSVATPVAREILEAALQIRNVEKK